MHAGLGSRGSRTRETQRRLKPGAGAYSAVGDDPPVRGDTAKSALGGVVPLCKTAQRPLERWRVMGG